MIKIYIGIVILIITIWASIPLVVYLGYYNMFYTSLFLTNFFAIISGICLIIKGLSERFERKKK